MVSGPGRFAEVPGVGERAEREREIEGGGQRVLAGVFGGEGWQGQFGFAVIFEVGLVPKRKNGGITDKFTENSQKGCAGPGVPFSYGLKCDEQGINFLVGPGL